MVNQPLKKKIYGKSVSCIITLCNEWGWSKKDMYSNTVNTTLLLQLQCFHRHVMEDSGFLGHQIALLGKWFLMFFRNFRIHLPRNTASHPRMQVSSTLLVTVKKQYIQRIKAKSYMPHTGIWDVSYMWSVSLIRISWKLTFLGAFARLWKVTTSFLTSVWPPVCPHGTTQLPLDEFSWNLILEYFFKVCWENSNFIKIEQE
jgi:hypothetical protein